MPVQDQKWVLLTGATGFVGSALAARLLATGHHVVCLSRLDPQAERTRSAVKAASRGLGGYLLADDYSRLHVIDFDFDEPEKAWAQLDGYSIDQVWHIAAEMSYTQFKMAQSSKRNVGSTCELYRLIEATHPECRRFYYCSTAYTQGVNAFAAQNMGSNLAAEVVNSYQASKWVAELNLELLAHRSRLPLTIFRPSIVMGDEQTGWNGGSLFGPYGLMFALYRVSRMGFRHFHLDLNPDAVANAIPINRLVQAMHALTARQLQPENLEFFVCGADSGPPMGACFNAVRTSLGIDIVFGRPRTLGDHLIDKVVQLNRAFMDKTWKFDNQTLAREIPDDYQPYHLSTAMVDALMRSFLEDVKKGNIGRDDKGSKGRLKHYLGMLGVEYRYNTVPLTMDDVRTIAGRMAADQLKRIPLLSHLVSGLL